MAQFQRINSAVEPRVALASILTDNHYNPLINQLTTHLEFLELALIHRLSDVLQDEHDGLLQQLALYWVSHERE